MREERTIIVAVCTLVVTCGLAISAWVLFSGEIQEDGIDALFLLSSCLLLAGAFSLPLRKALPPGLIQRLLSKARRRGTGTKAAGADAADRAPQESSDAG